MGTKGHAVELAGTGREAQLELSKESLNFSACIVGNTYQTTITLRNIGDMTHQIKASFTGGPPEFKVLCRL